MIKFQNQNSLYVYLRIIEQSNCKLLRAIYDLRVGNEGYLRFPILVSINGDPNVYRDLIDKYKLTQDVQFVINYGEQTFGGNLHNLVCQCQTDYLVLLGDDDWISPGYFDLITESLRKIPRFNSTLVYSICLKTMIFLD